MNVSIAKPTESRLRNDQADLPADSRLSPVQSTNLINSKVKNQQNNLYTSRFNGELPEDRFRKSKSKSIKLRESNVTKLSLNNDVVNVRQEKPVLNSSAKGFVIKGFEDLQFQNKQIKKFSITSVVKEKDLIKESNYFDESREGDNQINPVVDKNRADFRIGNFESFETFQVKTYLFDRNLTRKIGN